MRRNTILVALVLAAALFSDSWKGIWRLAAYEPAGPPAAAGTTIALLDLAKVFNAHAGFKVKMDALRYDVAQAELDLVNRKADLQKLADKLATLIKESPEAIQLNEKITRESADLTIMVQQQKADFFKRESDCYTVGYKDIMEVVAKYADARGIEVVMRFSDEALDPNDPQSIQKELNKAVVYHNCTDITDDIIKVFSAKPAD